jgi:hypothetical protein
VQDVGADLAAPGDLALLAADGRELLLALLALELGELRLEQRHRRRLVLQLAALVLAGHDDAGRQVGEPDGRVGRVHPLPAGPRGAVHVDAQLVVGDRDSSSTSSSIGTTSTLAKAVCRRACESNGLIRTSRCTPRSRAAGRTRAGRGR